MSSMREKTPEVVERRDTAGGGDFERVVEALQPGQLRSVQLKALTEDLGFRVPELSELGLISEQTFRNWRNDPAATGLPRPLDDLRAIAEHMLDSGQWKPHQIGAWFTQRNRQLEQEIPLDVLAAGRFEDVLAASSRHMAIAV